MKRIGMKWGATLVCSASVLLLTASVGNAGLIPWVWNGLFGPHCPKNQCAPACPPPCSPCGTTYAPSPCGPGGCGIQSAYYVSSSCCDPCGTSVCGVSQCGVTGCGPAGCPGGDCGISTPATGERTPEPDGGVPQTFRGGAEGSSTEDDWKTRNPEGNTENPPTPGSESTEVEAYKPPEPIPGKDAAPTPKLNEAEPAPGDAAPGPEGESATGEDGAAGPNLFNELHPVTWRPAVGQKRLTRQPTYAKARLIRRPRQAKGEWLVVPSTENIAKR